MGTVIVEKVYLIASEYAEAEGHGRALHKESIEHKRKNNINDKDNPVEAHILGAAAQKAFQIYSGLPWNKLINDFGKHPHFDPNIMVKAVSLKHIDRAKLLIKHSDKAISKRIYILIQELDRLIFEVKGGLAGSSAVDPAYAYHFDFGGRGSPCAATYLNQLFPVLKLRSPKWHTA